ncbi:hypothetical protein [Nostoc flagelliforme]|nr:hypothetical protein [Nostoc flagelliforme]
MTRSRPIKLSRSWQDIYLSEWADKEIDDVLPKGIAYMPRAAVCRDLYGGAETTLKRDLSCLVPMKIKPKGFDFKPQDEGFSRETMQVLFEFRKLVKRFQYETAVDKIHQRMEEIYGNSECSS